MSPADLVEHRLRVEHGLRASLGGSIEDLVLLSGGASRETWSFVHVLDDAVRRLVLRRDPDDDRPRIGSMALEAAAIAAAERAGVAVPRLVVSGERLGELDTAFLVSEHIGGETLGPRIVRDPELAEARSRFAADCGAALARIHRIEVTDVDDIETTDPLAELTEQFVEVGAPSAAVALALRLLADRPPTTRSGVVVHGDFRNGNLIVDPDGVRSVLDWELVHVGDPAEDIGWLCTPVWCFGGPGEVGGVGDLGDLLDAYEAEAGWRPGVDDARWWKLFGSAKWATACLRSAAAFASGERRTLDAAALARRVGENELDLLATIEELDW